MPRSKPKVLTVLVRRSNCDIIKFFRVKGLEAVSIKFRIGHDYTDHLLRVDTPIDLRELRNPEISLMRISKNYIWATSPSCALCKTLSKFPCIPDSLQYRNCEEGVYVKVIVKGSFDACRLLRELNHRGLNASIVSMKDFDGKPLLTEKQEQILNIAVELGYFENPKQIVLEDLVTITKTSKSALNRSLRRGVNKIVKWFINNYIRQ